MDDDARVERKYLKDTLVLETRYQTSTGSAKVLDYMPIAERPVVTRIVEGISGCVSLRNELVIRFDYGRTVPWVTNREGRWTAIAGPDAVELETAIPLRSEGLKSIAKFEVREGERIAFQGPRLGCARPRSQGHRATRLRRPARTLALGALGNPRERL